MKKLGAKEFKGIYLKRMPTSVVASQIFPNFEYDMEEDH